MYIVLASLLTGMQWISIFTGFSLALFYLFERMSFVGNNSEIAECFIQALL